MKQLHEYLKPPVEKSPEAKAADLRSMIARMAAKQGAKHGPR